MPSNQIHRNLLLTLTILCLHYSNLAAQPQTVPYEHRVVVPTTFLDFERDVDDSLAENVNQLAVRGFEVGAIMGGHAPLLNTLLQRKPYVPGLVDHGGHVFVIMHRPVGQPAPAREYRFLHTRTHLGVEKIVAAYGRDGFRLTVTAWEGDYFHAAFERVSDADKVDYRVFRTARRRGWPEHMLNDADAKNRARRAIPMTLDSALVELGAPAPTAAEFVWESDAPNERFRFKSRLNTRAAAGFRVQLVRLRGNVLDIGLLKPAGATGPAPPLELEDAPWGGPCGRGSIAGADIYTDGDVYCVAEDPKGPITNRGFDMVVAPDPNMDDQLFFGRSSCQARALARTSRPVGIRVSRALQLESEINRLVQPGFRITRAFAGIREDGDQRLVFMSSQLPLPVVTGAPANSSPAPPLTAHPDGLGQQTLAQREQEINARLASELRTFNVESWAEINDTRGNQHVLLLGCASARFEREHAETFLRGLLARTPYASFRIRNVILVEP